MVDKLPGCLGQGRRFHKWTYKDEKFFERICFDTTGFEIAFPLSTKSAQADDNCKNHMTSNITSCAHLQSRSKFTIIRLYGNQMHRKHISHRKQHKSRNPCKHKFRMEKISQTQKLNRCCTEIQQ